MFLKCSRYYVYLNPGLTIVFNGDKYFSENGLKRSFRRQ